MANGLSTYSWQEADPNQVLQKVLAGQDIATALGASIGAQSAQQLYSYVQTKLMPAFQNYYSQAEQSLTGVNPAFNPQNYSLNVNLKTGTHGEGASANRAAPLEDALAEIQTKAIGIENAKKAAETYQKTGQIKPFPTTEQLVQQTASQLWKGTNFSSADLSYLSKKVTEPRKPEDMAMANAAAARVGAPLPYPNEKIGEIVGGGVFQDAAQAQQAYTGGKLNTVGQNVVASNSSANLKGGVNQVVNNPDGTFQWNGQTFRSKEEAVQAANRIGVTSLRFPDGTTSGTQGTSSTQGGTPMTGGTTGGTSGVTGTSGGQPGSSISPEGTANALSVLNQYLNNGTIDSGTYQFFKAAVEAWNPDQQIDYANILNTFEQIKNSDINPHFKEQADLFINDLQTNRQYLQDTHALEAQQNTEQTQQAKEAIQKNLAASGMMFTGEAVKQLGAESAFATEGTAQAAKSAIPTISPFAAGQGQLQKQAGAAASSAELRYQKSLKDLAQQAEATLGTTGASAVLPGVKMIGGITGSMEEQKRAAQASALSGLYSQQQTNVAAQEPQKVFNE